MRKNSTGLYLKIESGYKELSAEFPMANDDFVPVAYDRITPWWRALSRHENYNDAVYSGIKTTNGLGCMIIATRNNGWVKCDGTEFGPPIN
jgi:hypothetical protein